MSRNNTNFSQEVTVRLKAFLEQRGADKESGLRYYQALVAEYFASDLAARGLLVFHVVGFGKTLTMLACMDAILNVPGSTVRKAFAITPKKLRSNIQKELNKYKRMRPDTLLAESQIEFQTLSASLESKLKASLKALMGGLSRKVDTLNDILVVVDEAHLLFRMIANGSKTGVAFYDLVMRSPRARLLFLTGTPITNEIFQMAPCFNMLADPPAILPESGAKFDEFFVTREGDRLQNEHMLANRISGLVSYAGPNLLDPSAKVERDPRFPRELPATDIRVAMTQLQTQAYASMRDLERSEAVHGRRDVNPYERFSRKSTSSSYRSRSRQLGNYCPPIRLLKDLQMLVRNKDAKVEFDESMLEGLSLKELSSPKFETILRIARENPGLGCVYCEFTGIGGLSSLAAFLRKSGYSELREDTRRGDLGGKPRDKTFLRVLADTDAGFVLRMVNEEKAVGLLLLSKTAGQGLDIKELRWACELCTLFTPAEEIQLRGRGVRMDSHAELPEEERTFRLFRLIAVPDPQVARDQPVLASEPSSDEHVLEACLRKRALGEQAEKLMMSVAIECAVVNESATGCRICTPTDQPRFTHTHDVLSDLAVDAQSGDPCQPLQTSQLEARPLELPALDGPPRKVFVVEDPSAGLYKFRLYREAAELGGHVLISAADPIYKEVAALL